MNRLIYILVYLGISISGLMIGYGIGKKHNPAPSIFKMKEEFFTGKVIMTPTVWMSFQEQAYNLGSFRSFVTYSPINWNTLSADSMMAIKDAYWKSDSVDLREYINDLIYKP